MFNRRHRRRISKSSKKLHVLYRKEISNIPSNMWVCIILLKDSPRDALKEGLCVHEPVVDAIPYKGIFVRSSWCSRRRRIDEDEINTPQRAANCLEEAVRPFTAMRTICLSSHTDVTFRHPLPVFRCQSTAS
ncbi:hypothetical protein TNCV_4705611 [Trichonephila clavipes]|nr:hypothetical protein TNCV_4705611 [Trichonephila clavipes]